jgi:hypothetical protein
MIVVGGKEHGVSSEINELVVKGGETMVSLGIRRSSRGLIISARIHPIFEEFFREQANEKTSVDEISRQWFPLKDQADLEVWHILQDPGVVRGNSASYRINQPGYPLVQSDQTGRIINLSFLRLVGASEPTGISFEVKGAYTLTYIRQLASEVGGAVKQFYIDCLKPVDLLVTVNTQENR